MFYSVIETRDFSLFNQSAQALLKGYFIKQYIRRDCIEVTGVPLTPDVNAKQIIVEIGQLMGMELTEHHVSIAHPLPATRNIKNRLIAKFVHRYVKDEFYKKRKMMAVKTTKDLPSVARNGPILIRRFILMSRLRLIVGNCSVL